MGTPVVLSVCGDAGGAGALAPVLRRLGDERKVHLASFAYLQSIEILAQRGIPAAAIPPDADESWAEQELRRHGPALLLVATSHNELNHEKTFVGAARRNRVPSLAVLDFWAAYGKRFADSAGRLVYLPDRVAAMDDAARAGLIAAGVPENTIVVTGHPGFDELAARRAAFTPAERAAVRAAAGATGPLVLFVSQPLREFYGGAGSPGYLGYDEHLVLRLVVDALERSTPEARAPITLLLRPHPREDAQSYNAVRSERIRIVVSRDGDARAAALASDVVLGMTSMLLVEASFLGCRVVSLQPGLRGTNALPPGVAARLETVYEQAQVVTTIGRLLNESADPRGASRPAESWGAPPLATSRVAACVYSMLRI